MKENQERRAEFIKIEESLGITTQNFEKKFIFPISTEKQAFLLNKFEPLPSQLHGLQMEFIKKVAFFQSQLIFAAGESLKVPVSTTIVAISLCHFYYSRKSYIQSDFRDIAMGAMFLACKSEETLRKSYQIAAVFDHIFKVHFLKYLKVLQGQKGYIRALELNSIQFQYMKNKVLQGQSDILFELGFEIYKLFDIPHRYVGILLKSFDRHPKSLQISQKTWTILNDLYKTQVCLFYPGQILASASVYLALAKMNISMPAVPWWILMEANLESIEEIILELEELYSITNQHIINIDVISMKLEEIGKNSHGLVNVFPVNYYRKIMLDRQNKLRMKLIDLLIEEKAMEFEKQEFEKQKNQEVRSNQNKKKKHKKEKDKRKKKEKEKEKEKSKKKHHRRYSSSESGRRSRDKRKKESRSSSKDKSINQNSHQKQHQERNNDDTPKLQEKKNECIQESIKKDAFEKPALNEENAKIINSQALNIANPKDLLSKISSQLKKHQEKKQKNAEKQDESDQELLAELIKIKKSKANKIQNPPNSQN